MRIIGVEVAGGAAVFCEELPHGGDPHRIAWELGYRIVRPLSATGLSPDLTLTVQVGRQGRGRPPRAAHARNDFRGAANSEEEPILRQRLAAYGIVISQRGILATQFSELTAVGGLWGLPGGGINPGEAPSEALLREIAEETGQRATITQLLDIQTDHWIGHSPSGILEDFHAVRIIYAVRCSEPSRPIVHDWGGTTAAAKWVSTDHWTATPWSAGTRALLSRHLQQIRLQYGPR